MRTLQLISFLLFLSSCSTPLFIGEKNIELYRIEENDRFGYIDQKGNIRIIPEFETYNLEFDSECLSGFSSSNFAIIRKDGLFGTINWKGELLISPQYEALFCENDSTLIAYKDQKFGIINSLGDTIVPFLFDRRYFLDSHKIFPSEINGKSIIYFPGYDSIAWTDYDDISPFFDGYAIVKKNKKNGVIDQELKLIVDTIYQEVDVFSSSIFNVKLNNEWKYIKINEDKPIPGRFEKASSFYDGIATVKNGKYCAIDTSGLQLLPPIFDYLEYVGPNDDGDRIFMFCNQEDYFFGEAKCGLINMNGDTILPQKYSDIFYFYDIAEVTSTQNGKSGVINVKNGKTIIPCNFDAIEFYDDGISTLHFYDNQGKRFYGYINKRKKIIWSNNKALLKEKLKKQ